MKLIFLLLLQSCAFLHHAQVGEIKYKKNHVRMPFEIKVSETGFDVQELGDIAGSLSNGNDAAGTTKEIADIIGMFQMGPRTGKPTYNEKYADSIAKAIYQK